MHCSSCRQERLGGLRCAACGKPMTPRPREVLEQELAHIHFLLEELPHWDSASVPKGVRQYLTQRYERQARILSSVLAEAPVAPAAESAPAQAEVQAVAAPEAVATLEAVSAPEAVSASARPLARATSCR